MAEFCLDCWNKMNGTNEPKINYVLSRDLELCEGCGKYKHTIIVRRSFILPYRIFCVFFKLPYLLIKKIINFILKK